MKNKMLHWNQTSSSIDETLKSSSSCMAMALKVVMIISGNTNLFI